MIAQESREAVASLARAVLDVRPLVDVLEAPVCLASSRKGQRQNAVCCADESAREDLLNQVGGHIGAPRFAWKRSDAAGDLTVFEQAVSARLKSWDPDPFQIAQPAMPEAGQIIEEVIRGSFEQKFNRVECGSFDSGPLAAYSAGDRRNKAVVIVSACGMPAKICERWMRELGRDHFVITWESRGLFGEAKNSDTRAHDVQSQVNDLFTVMDHFGVQKAHLMGFCGGAVVAIMGAAARPERVATLSIWHGDFELGGDCPKTEHQRNLKALMLMAAGGRADAKEIYTQFRRSIRTSSRSDLDHLVLYPFASPELLFRYGKLNGSIMGTNISPLLGKVVQRSLVVTSTDDHTAHPEGSRRVAARLARADLHVEPHGDHLSLFDAQQNLTELAACFIDREGW